MSAGQLSAGIQLELRIGQRVRIKDDYEGKPTVGVITGLQVDTEGALRCDVLLDQPIVIRPREPDDREIRIHRQTVYAQDVRPDDSHAELARLVLSLNPASEHIGAGMLAQLKSLARRAMEGGAA